MRPLHRNTLLVHSISARAHAPIRIFTSQVHTSLYRRSTRTCECLTSLQQSIKSFRRARDIDPNGNELLYDQAVVNTIAGKQPDALESLKGAFEKGYSAVLAKNDPELKPLEMNPEFSKLLAQFGPK